MNHTQRPSATYFGSNTLVTVVVAVVALYFAREVLIPIALAVLLGFLLSPLVVRLRHWGFARIPAVLAVVLIFSSVIALIGWLMTMQLVDVAGKLPRYQENIREKIKSFRLPDGGTVSRTAKALEGLKKDLNLSPEPAMIGNSTNPSAVPDANKPVPVEVHEPVYTYVLRLIGNILGSLLHPLLTAGIVFVLVIFMLLQHEDLRYRLIRLAGSGQLNVTTRALEDAAGRVSKYLQMLFVVNVIFGTAIGVGLYFLGVPNPILWGALAAVLRFVPFVGVWTAAALSALVALAVEPGWAKPVLSIALFIGIDVIVTNFLEPLLYGASTGVSPLAILLAAIFWTWLWGAIGLLLSTPLTVCLVVLGRYVPALEFLSVLFGDEPVMSRAARVYQRLLAMDLEEATSLAEGFLKEKSLADLFDTVLIPALSMAEKDRHRGALDEAHERFILENMRFLIDDMADREQELKEKDNRTNGRPTPTSKPKVAATKSPESFAVLCIPARDEADEIAAVMLAHLLKPHGIAAHVFAPSASPLDHCNEAAQWQAGLICVSAVPPAALMKARDLCKCLQSQSSDTRIILGLWNEPDERVHKRLPAAVNCDVVVSLRHAVARIVALKPPTIHRSVEPIVAEKKRR